MHGNYETYLQNGSSRNRMRELGGRGVDWIEVAQDRDKWRDVQRCNEPSDSINCGEFRDMLKNCSTRTLWHGVSRQVSLSLQSTKALRESRGIALHCFQTSAVEGVEGSASRPDRTLPPGKTRYPLCRRVGGPQAREGRRKISPHRDSIPGPSSPQSVAIQTELPGP